MAGKIAQVPGPVYASPDLAETGRGESFLSTEGAGPTTPALCGVFMMNGNRIGAHSRVRVEEGIDAGRLADRLPVASGGRADLCGFCRSPLPADPGGSMSGFDQWPVWTAAFQPAWLEKVRYRHRSVS